jgi:hypothetical protein
MRFTADEGADMHCQPLGQARELERVFNWLDDTLG